MRYKRFIDRQIGRRLTKVRISEGISQGQLAKAIGVSVGAIQAYERGRSRIPTERLADIARVLRQQPGDLFAQPILPPTLGFYGRGADSHKIDADVAIKTACGVPMDAPGHLAWERWYSRIHSENRARVDAELAHILDPRNGIFHMQYRLMGWDNVERCIIDFGRMIFDVDQKPVRLQGIMLDITQEPRTSTTDDRIAAILATIKKHLMGAASLFLALLLDCGNHGRRIEADHLGQVDELDHVEAPFAALKTGNPSLRAFELLGELNLPETGPFALGDYQFYQPIMALAANGFHLF